MKAILLKSVMPLAAVMLASAGAIGTKDAAAKTDAVEIQGWKRIDAFDCEEKRTCNNEGSVICVDGIDPMYAKPTPESDCELLLTHRD